ncbi:hypothetical protein DL95DRAFT_437156 [Leptodontidium sp. 2 PMI_412]|nr:hypothetical protein BKA61DRAFT_301996 [Leptodontidium sp. MPI-SDFR-AT-0119]KAH9211519.1 hypothetical protein DL95DRAFT_437156 [Leptodontidium sp. 2 PMI_412]
MSSNSPLTILEQARARHAERARQGIKEDGINKVRRTFYKSLPVPYPSTFLAPLPDPSSIKVNRIDFKNSVLSEYKKCFAVVLDDVLSKEECEDLIKYAEMSVGAHGNHPVPQGGESETEIAEREALTNPEDDGWKPALVNAGGNYEILAVHYRNSDRIIWDQAEVAKRIWKRIMQAEGIASYFGELAGEEYVPVVGGSAMYKGEKRVVTDQGLNERMRFLRYGPGQYFKEHCDGQYESEDGLSESFYTCHLYLNDSAQVLGIPAGSELDSPSLLRGGATTFHSIRREHRMDIDPKIGRVLIFQQRRLLHSGDEVLSGVKYTMRSDLMYRFESTDEHEGDQDGVVDFGVVDM